MLRNTVRETARRAAAAGSSSVKSHAVPRRCVCSSAVRHQRDDDPSTSSKDKGVARQSVNLFDEEKAKDGQTQHRTQYNIDPFSLKPSGDHFEYPLVTQKWLAQQTKRPQKVRMLARDFIHDALYNPHYGYFSRHAVLLPDVQRAARSITKEGAFDFHELVSEKAFAVAVEERYRAFEEDLDAQDQADVKRNKQDMEQKILQTLQPLKTKKQPPLDTAKDETKTTGDEKGKRRATRVIPAQRTGSRYSLEEAQRRGRLSVARQLMNEKEEGEHDRDVKAMAARQVWHTPTELFKPHYAHSVARYMLENLQSGEPLRVYEVGAGSGALAKDILDYVCERHADVYERMTYHIIEISPRLADQQRQKLQKHIAVNGQRVQITNKSVLEWDTLEPNACFFLAMEVFDNLTHDVVRYATDTLLPYQGLVSIDETGDIHELWEPLQDDLIRDTMRLSDPRANALPLSAPAWMRFAPDAVRRYLTHNIPFYPNLTKAHYVPTGSVQLLRILAKKFPRHRMVMSDFHALPESLAGINAPVVQTRLNGTMIAVSRYTVYQGFFDIFFPTNFEHLQTMHANVMKYASKEDDKDDQQRASRIVSHRDFLQTYADVRQTTCRDGSNPMLSWYANASWFLS